MLSQEYFERRLFDLFELSPIKYIKGQGFLINSNERISIDWELNVSIIGEILFVLSSDEIIFNDSNNRHFKEWTIKGESIEGYKIEAKKVFIHGYSIGDKNNSRENTYFSNFNSMDITQGEINDIESIIGYLHNFYFAGRNFDVNVANYNFHFLQHEKDKELMEMFKNGRINKAFFSVIQTSLHKDEDLENVINIIDNISCLTNFFSMNMAIVPIFKFYKKNKLIGIKIRSFKLFPYIKSKWILDNFYIREGIKSGIEQCYDSFINIEKQLDLRTLINGLIAMMVQPYTDLKIAILLISYELLLSKYLLYKGLKEEDIKNISIQDKLYKINNFLRFIPRRLLKDDLRENVRNPLFHQGELPFFNSEEIYNVFVTYWDLLIRIILKILNYAGKYLEPNTNKIKQVS